MANSNNRIAKNAVFLYLRMAMVMAISLYTVRVVLQVLGVEDYGIYSAVGGIVSTLSVVTTVLATASNRFFSIDLGKNDLSSLNRDFNSIFTLYLLFGVVVLIIAESAGCWFLFNKMTIPEGRMGAAFVVLQCTIAMFIISIFSAPYQAMIISYERMNIYAYVGLIDVCLKLVVVFLLKFCGRDKLILYSCLVMLTQFISQSIYVLYSKVNFKDQVTFHLKQKRGDIKKVTSFSMWTFIGSLANVCNTQGLNLVLNVFFGPVVNAAYLIGTQVKSALSMFGSNFFTAVKPVLIKEYAANNMGYVRKLFFFSSKSIFILLFLFIFPIFYNAEEVLSIWLGEVGEYMVVFTRLMLIYAILLCVSDPISIIVQAANKVKPYHIIVDGFTLCSLPLSYLSFKLGSGPEVALYITVIIFIVAHFIRLVFLQRITEIEILSYCIEVILRLLISIILTYSIASIVNYIIVSSGFWMFALKVAIEMIVALSISVMVMFNKDEWFSIITIIKSKLRRSTAICDE